VENITHCPNPRCEGGREHSNEDGDGDGSGSGVIFVCNDVDIGFARDMNGVDWQFGMKARRVPRMRIVLIDDDQHGRAEHRNDRRSKG
jgi:hypothetical protein